MNVNKKEVKLVLAFLCFGILLGSSFYAFTLNYWAQASFPNNSGSSPSLTESPYVNFTQALYHGPEEVSFQESASYTIYTDGVNGYVKNESSSTICYGGPGDIGGVDGGNTSDLITSTLAQLTPSRTWFETVIIRGNFSKQMIDTKIVVPDYTCMYMQDAILKLAANTNNHMFEVGVWSGGSVSSLGSSVIFIGGNLNGNKDSQSGGNGLNIAGQHVKVLRSQIVNWKNNGIRIEGKGTYNDLTRDVLVEGVTVQSVGQVGIKIGDYVSDSWIERNWLRNMNNDGIGIYVLATQGMTLGAIYIRENWVYEWGYQGIYAIGMELYIQNNWVFETGKELIRVEAQAATDHFETRVQENSCWSGGTSANNTYAGILLKGTAGGQVRNCDVSGNTIGKETGEHTRLAYGILEYTDADYNNIHDNHIGIMGSNDVQTAIQWMGTHTEVYHNQGFITENEGTVTISSGTTAQNFTHGLDYTPSAGEISVTAIESLGSASFYWFDTITDETVEVNVNADPGQDVDFAWKIR